MASPSASPVNSSAQTTHARSIMTLDSYVSRGQAPPSSVPRDHGMLQDFAAYLELRLKSQNLSMLRRIFADFLNEQEVTLAPMMQQGCTIITVFPVLRTSAQRRRQAEFLLSKPKFHLDSRGCVFLYLQYRAATRNMALLKHLFLEFVWQRETSLLDFVELGCQVISVIPFELPQRTQMIPPARPLPPRVVQQESPRAVEAAAEQEQVTSEVAVVEKTRKARKRRDAASKAAPRQPSTALASASAHTEADVAEPQVVSNKHKGKPKRVVKVRRSAVAATEQQVAAAPSEPEIVNTRRRRKRVRFASTSESATSEANQDENVHAPPALGPVAESAPKRRKTPKPSAVPPRREVVAASIEQAEAVPTDAEALPAEASPIEALPIEATPTEAVLSKPQVVTRRRRKRVRATATTRSTRSGANQDENVPPVLDPAAVSTPKHRKTPKPSAVPPRRESADASMKQAEAMPTEALSTKAAPTEVLPAEALPTEASPTEVLSGPGRKRGRERNTEDGGQKEAGKKSHKRGKPFMSEDMCRSQLELTRKMEAFEAQIPWEAAYGNVPAPFDAQRHPELAKKFCRFWRRHSRAVWERNFWAPKSRRLNLSDFNKRNNRQLTAKNAFESLIVSVYEEFGAAFFVKLDSQKPRHPGWWYRGPIVALFALQQIKGEDAMWDYVKNEALERFPDCKLPIPLTASNSGAMRSRHIRESESMWMGNHRLTTGMLREIAALKAEEQACEQTETSQATTVVPEREPENSIAVAEALGLM